MVTKAIFGWIILLAIFAGFTGWVLNIVALAHITSMSVLAVMRIIGILIPFVGAVLGYVH